MWVQMARRAGTHRRDGCDARGAGPDAALSAGERADRRARERSALAHDARGEGRAAAAIWNRKREIQDAQGRFDPAKAQALIGAGIGQVARPSEIAGGGSRPPPRARAVRERRAEVADREHAARHPGDVSRGGAARPRAPGGTHFPVPIGLASTWDPPLVERVMSVAALEARARGAQHVLSPVVDLGRDPRWGRIEETYGEDPYLVTQMGVAAVRGYQGTSLPLAADKVFATLKHFAGHGSHEGGINTAPPLVSERLLRAELLVPFEAAVKAGAHTVMPSYNEVDGVPSHANRWLLTDVLRREWGFDGLVVSDYFGIEQLRTRHRVAADRADAGVAGARGGRRPGAARPARLSRARRAGEERPGRRVGDRPLGRARAAREVPGRPVREPVRRSRTRASASATRPSTRRSRSRRRASRSSCSRTRADCCRSIARGSRRSPSSARTPRGCTSAATHSDPGRGVDVLAGITARPGAGVKVAVRGGRAHHRARRQLGRATRWCSAIRRRTARASRRPCKVARQADAIVLAIGTNESVSREAWADNHLGDVADLALDEQPGGAGRGDARRPASRSSRC